MEFDMGNLIFIVYSEKNYTHYNLTICRWFSYIYSRWILSGWYEGEVGHCTWSTSNICNRQYDSLKLGVSTNRINLIKFIRLMHAEAKKIDWKVKLLLQEQQLQSLTKGEIIL
jgi:hypothetical protein